MTDMASPVTRQELHDAIAPLATRQELHDAIAQLATKRDLEQFATKRDLEQFATKRDLEQFATKRDLELWGGALFERMLQELGRMIRAAQEETRTWISTLDDKYRDLPERVARLEAKLP